MKKKDGKKDGKIYTKGSRFMRSQEQMITLMSWQNVCADNILHYNESSCENFTSDLGKKRKKTPGGN